MDAISSRKQMHANLRTQLEELLHVYSPFEVRAYWRQVQCVPARLDPGEVRPRSVSTRHTCGFTR
jgi:hypothetical protein